MWQTAGAAEKSARQITELNAGMERDHAGMTVERSWRNTFDNGTSCGRILLRRGFS